jgi:hypothetical protein
MCTTERATLKPACHVPGPCSTWAGCLIASCWALLSAAAALYAFLSSTLPVRYVGPLPTGPAWGPAWLSGFMVFADVLITVPMTLLLFLLLGVGLVHLRRHSRPGAAWIGTIAAGFTLEIAYAIGIGGPDTFVDYTGPAVPDWADLVDTALFLVLGAVMIRILIAARRTSAPRPVGSPLTSEPQLPRCGTIRPAFPSRPGRRIPAMRFNGRA